MFAINLEITFKFLEKNIRNTREKILITEKSTETGKQEQHQQKITEIRNQQRQKTGQQKQYQQKLTENNRNTIKAS